MEDTLENGHINLNNEAPLSISEGLDVVLLSADEVLVQFGTRSYPSELLRDADLTGILGQLVARLLRGPANVGELLANIRAEDQAEAKALINNLLQRGILTNTLTSPCCSNTSITALPESQG